MTPHTVTEKHPPLPLSELTDLLNGFATAPRVEQHGIIDQLVSIHPVLSMALGPGSTFRRARVLDQAEVPSSFRELIWRQDILAPRGRANPEGFRVLYLSHLRDTALSEVGASNDPVVISDFEVLPGRSIRIAPIGEFLQVNRTGRGRFSGDLSDKMTSLINACHYEAAQSLLITDSFLLDCLLNRDDDYELSSRVAFAIFRKMESVGGVAFPSVRHAGGMNLAVRTNVFWQSWGIVGVNRGKASHLAQGFYSLRDVKAARRLGGAGELDWDDEILPDHVVGRFKRPWTPTT